jgi:hypothetical protein
VKLKRWSLAEDSNGNLMFKFDGKVQAVMRNPAKACPGTKLAKICVD